MEAGKLRHRIKIEVSPTYAANSVGQQIPDWQTYLDKVPSSFEPEKGMEHFEAAGQVVPEPALFRIRYRDGIVASMRIIFRGKVWDISSVVEKGGRARELLIYAGTGLTEG